jgi:crossover junction endodeoxyribonuclease RuvC
MPSYFVGIDPGVSGGIAVVNRRGRVIWVKRMPATPSELVATMREVPTPAMVLVEYVRSRPRQASQAVFKFGRGFGRLESAIAAADLPSKFITPKVWQTKMECLTQGDKNISKARAAGLFPLHVVTHAIADALLLAECCRQLEVDSFRSNTRALR